MSFLEADLSISQEEIDEIKATLANDGQADSFPNAMSEAEAKVRDWTARYVVPEETLRRLWRPLVLYVLGGLVGSVSKARKDAYDEAMSELTDIRDGKFPQYELADPQPPGLATNAGAWGSKTKIETR